MSDTAVAILGMLAAFITASVTAFLTEPVKSYVTEKVRLKNIRLSLYKEIAQNYFMIASFGGSDLSDEKISLLLTGWISNKCYTNVIENSVEEYYRLKDVMTIDMVYKWISTMMLPTTKTRKEHGHMLMLYGKIYNDAVSDSLNGGRLSKSAMMKVVGKHRMDELLNPKSIKKSNAFTALEQNSTGNSGEVHQKDNPAGVGS